MKHDSLVHVLNVFTFTKSIRLQFKYVFTTFFSVFINAENY